LEILFSGILIRKNLNREILILKKFAQPLIKYYSLFEIEAGGKVVTSWNSIPAARV